jgi:hypothetical protein
MSLKSLEYALAAESYRSGLANPIVEAHPVDAFTSAVNAAQSGAAALVPPMPLQLPSKKIK